MCERVSLADAAKELGCSVQSVREHMKRGIWDLGSVVKNPNTKSNKKYSYHIYRSKLDRHLGKGGKKGMLRKSAEAVGVVRKENVLGAGATDHDEWRRFELLTDDENEIKRCESLCKEKGLTRQELAVILFTLRIRPGFQKADFGI